VQVIEFLAQLLERKEIVDLNVAKIDELARVYKVEATKNAEIRFRFMRLCIKARVMGRLEEILQFANSNFRMKFVRPVYKELGTWPEARQKAIENFEKIKNQMMTVCVHTIAKDLGI
jgi:leukotriene-A4 hydrolase